MTVAAPPAPTRPDLFVVDPARLDVIAREATATCRPAGEPVERFLGSLVTPVREWCEARPDRVQAAYICPPKNDSLWVYVIARNPRDFDLDDQVSLLGDTLRANGWRAFVGALPPPSDESSFSSFYNPSTAVVAYADR